LAPTEAPDFPGSREERARSGSPRADGATRREARSKSCRPAEPIREPCGKPVCGTPQRKAFVLSMRDGRAHLALPAPELHDQTRCAEH
jgi:hypothetical protein